MLRFARLLLADDRGAVHLLQGGDDVAGYVEYPVAYVGGTDLQIYHFFIYPEFLVSLAFAGGLHVH